DGSMEPETEFINSLDALDVSSLYGYLVHDAGMLLSQDLVGGGDALYRKLCSLREQGLVRKIGVSVYRPDELVALTARYDLDLVQLPCNAIDKRWEEPGLVEKIHQSGVEVHVRSVFLQGLLVMPREQISAYFDPWASLLAQWHEWCSRKNVTPVEACLGALSGKEWISKLVVGVTSTAQLDELAAATKTIIDDVSDIPQTNDEDLLNPARWQND
ncbi:MAG: aldo/keto reductase, partial [Pseudomonadota bacterium]